MCGENKERAVLLFSVAQMASGVRRARVGGLGACLCVRGVCGLRIVDYIFLARIENRIAGRTRCGRIKK